MTTNITTLISEDMSNALEEVNTEVLLPSREKLRKVFDHSSRIVNEMMIAAATQGLTFEVVESYQEARAEGLSIEDAVNYARRSWDI
jgi:hypothetical protein